MAKLLNEYFGSVYTEEKTSKIPGAPVEHEGNEPLRKIEATVEVAKMKIGTLNQSKSPNQMDFT